MNPLTIQDLIKANITLVRGSQPGGSIALTCYITEFDSSVAFPGRTKIYTGTQAEILEACVADGFGTTSRQYLAAQAFTSVSIPVNQVMIGRKDAGDATWTDAITAITAEDDSFALVCVDESQANKTDALQIAAYCESNWPFFLVSSSEAGAKTKAAGTLLADLFALKRKKTAYCWYDPEEATGYGPAEVDSAGAAVGAYGTGFSILNGQTLTLATVSGDTYDGFENTVTATVTAAVQTSSGFTTGLADAETIDVVIDASDEITITLSDLVAYFPEGIALATVAQVVAYLSDVAPQVSWAVVAGEIRATSQRPGSSSKIQFTGGSALATLGFSVSSETGTGDFAFGDTAQASELATLIDTAAAGANQVTEGTMSFSGTDDVGLTVDALADLFVASNTDNATTLADLKVAWDASAPHVAVAAMTVDATAVTLTFVDNLEHTVVAYSPATADITGITNTTEAVTPLDLDASAVGTKLHLESLDSGSDIEIQIIGGTMLTALGLEVGDYNGTGTDDNLFAMVWAGQVAYLASRLDAPDGSVPWDNMKLPVKGNGKTAVNSTARQNLRDQYANTYQVRTANYPGELHWGVNCAGFNGDFAVWGQLWLPLRLSESLKGYQDRMTDLGQRIPYDDQGIAQYDAQIKAVFRVADAAGAISFDGAPFNPLTKVTGYKSPTIAEQSASNRANGKLSGWVITQLDAGAAKAVELGIFLTSQ